jgi:hypothetical protein
MIKMIGRIPQQGRPIDLGLRLGGGDLSFGIPVRVTPVAAAIF